MDVCYQVQSLHPGSLSDNYLFSGWIPGDTKNVWFKQLNITPNHYSSTKNTEIIYNLSQIFKESIYVVKSNQKFDK